MTGKNVGGASNTALEKSNVSITIHKIMGIGTTPCQEREEAPILKII